MNVKKSERKRMTLVTSIGNFRDPSKLLRQVLQRISWVGRAVWTAVTDKRKHSEEFHYYLQRFLFCDLCAFLYHPHCVLVIKYTRSLLGSCIHACVCYACVFRHSSWLISARSILLVYKWRLLAKTCQRTHWMSRNASVRYDYDNLYYLLLIQCFMPQLWRSAGNWLYPLVNLHCSPFILWNLAQVNLLARDTHRFDQSWRSHNGHVRIWSSLFDTHSINM